jgi:adenosylmethionine-8-amino-7-oxononanoate aminotransferase
MTTPGIYAAFYDDATARGFLHSHSYTGNPLACSAALAVLDIFAADDVVVRNHAKARAFDVVAGVLREDPRIAHFRRAGMIWAFDVPAARPGFARAYAQAALQEGVLLRPLGNTVYFMPPYCVDEAQWSLLVGAARRALDAALRG